MKNGVRCFWRVVVVSSFLGAAVIPWRSDAAALFVYNTNDSGPGSLRQAIADNGALGGGNTIIFSNGVTGTITLFNGELFISNNVTILGSGANVLAVNGLGVVHRVFHITNATVSISGLTITNGHDFYGGGIYNDHAMLTVSSCAFSGNSSGSGGGGAIYNGGSSGNATLSVIGCTFSGNSANTSGVGGGIFNQCLAGTTTVSVVASTFSGNWANNAGGAIYSEGFNGTTATLSVTACTFSSNSAPRVGGIYFFGVSGASTLTIGDTILKTGTNGANIFSDEPVNSLGYNLCSDSGSGYLTATGDKINTDPMLGPLQDNGGPTLTHLPQPGSPAIDQGKSFGSTADQRGAPRPHVFPSIPQPPGGDGSDIGAVEVQSVEPCTFVLNTNDSGAGSLRQALLATNTSFTVLFQPNVTGTITLTNGELLITKNVPILGPGANVLAVNGNAASRVFHVSNSVVTISGLTITNGSAINSGGGIWNDTGTLTVSNCTISGNAATPRGGGIYNGAESGNAMLTLVASTVSGNSAPNGAGIFNDATLGGNVTLSVIASTVCSNAATYGGGIYSFAAAATNSAALTVIDSTLSGNSATNGGLGGGIYNVGLNGATATLHIGDTILKTGASGANLYNNGGTTTSLGYNLSNDDGGGNLAATGDQINTDPMLGPLQDNGGPTQTMAPLLGSPAIDQGKSFGVTTDQRGAPRPFDFPSIPNAIGGDGSDIGAVEIQSGDFPSILVTTTNDSGPGSLRQALLATNTSFTILFQSNVVGTITLTNGELVIGKNVAILGPGANVLAISGNNSSRVLDITNGFANISGLTIRDGTVLGFTGRPGQTVSGGGIFCEQTATLAMSDCVISNCAAIGGHGANVFTSGNGGNGGNGIGGGIRNDGKLTLDRCLVVNNQALGGSGGSGGSGQGGNGGNGIGSGIANYSPYNQAGVVLSGCTLGGNRATFGAGGGGHIPGTNGTAWAAGFYDFFGSTLINCTIASNVVNGAGTGRGGGIYVDDAYTALLSCTVAGNNADSSGGGIYIVADLAGVTNTIIADNTAASSPDVYGSFGLFTSGGYNLIGNTNGNSGFGATGDLLNVNPLLGALQDNGGPTPTMALLAGSPAIDRGNSFGLTTDQRGAPRPFDFPSITNAPGGDGSDIGAFEVGQPQLSIQAIGNAAVLSWPDYYANSSLQTNGSVTTSAGWANAPGTPAVTGTQYFLTNSPISGKAFFRLKSN